MIFIRPLTTLSLSNTSSIHFFHFLFLLICFPFVINFFEFKQQYYLDFIFNLIYIFFNILDTLRYYLNFAIDLI